ncbi:endonuclease/exonuclease/phosphatase family protein [Aquidulcibacter sp.]|uniref:endonuclease/exonuclease/phosphatase family protein n=1 Tax=Aquidulcibacter sp. TaxID=2052990 RepID=UPI0025BB485D|nr:endonuclease/exonuclease/phosphatase family protein [Aquidulcibacter sp.]MCA3696427.1 hypothetical protein [Aquidulcibacter sp.]
MRNFFQRFSLSALALPLIAVGAGGCQHGSANKPIAFETVQSGPALLPPSEETLTLVQWNVGYGGLGFDADFKADGGRHILPPSKRAVDRNLAGISTRLKTMQADVYLFQELARPGFLTYGRDVVATVGAALSGTRMMFSPDIDHIPPRIRHGLGVATRLASQDLKLVRLPDDPKLLAGFVVRRYHTQMVDLVVAGQPWTIINLHLSAFDSGAVRDAQLRAVLELATKAAAEGRHVVALGDWNMRFAPTQFPYTADPSAQFWIRDFPMAQIPPGWRLVYDPATPTVRTNEQPYLAGRNYTTIIDGALVSPDVEVVSVTTSDTGFVDTDHQPVRYVLRAKPKD